ncbi:hypothetical protein IWW55_000716 [Coemansia sp. RSA 2706]|nr:hypothetical protein IWW55_000716 [Coemansia sp. RSA 2706]KAJ2312254.1 hypothetical protein IWW54_002196 [Coemansia sp. RSA 2705]KAJ2316644.1 hypothetical protein IWW52_003535 [Coemansia sp. RSA 2704]KAJ2329286.1 hypothetical protein IWW51_000699 [Coemansia sp. RSA 2702]KAJ2366674.1 hypothetical protein H4S01_002578 [Coemansia sp. RSA 2610]KAJ2389012.1 hypothetical protein H4S02_002580 [Coemansia sp. RSA 2611]KAJ2738878.1 hypothetical protein H4R23_000848 [Coemansia sp. Cherry 401B]
MPLVTFDDNGSPGTPSAGSRPHPSASWQDKRYERVHRLEAELAATVARRQTETDAAARSPAPEPDYGSMLGSEHGSDASSEADARSEASSVFYSEGQPLLCTYQPLEYPGTGATSYGATGIATPPPIKAPEQYLPWDRRVRNALHSLCAPCCAGTEL